MNQLEKDVYPLSWPDDWVRARPQDRKMQSAWKKSAEEYREALLTEFERLKAPKCLISSNVPLTMRGSMTKGIEPVDPGVAVYFSRESKEDFRWQDALGIHEPAPTEDRIKSAFKALAVKYHPDSGGDLQMFQSLCQHRDNALRWINRQSSKEFGFVIACDAFKEVAQNMNAIRLTIAAIRQIERCGTSTLLERAFRGFSALPAEASESRG